MVFPHKFWRPFLDCMPQLFFRPPYVWFPVHLKGLLISLWYETLVVNWQNWLFTLFHQSRSILSPYPIAAQGDWLHRGASPWSTDIFLSLSRPKEPSAELKTHCKNYQTRQIRTPVLRIPPAVTSQAKMKNWLHECQKWVSHMIGQYAHI